MDGGLRSEQKRHLRILKEGGGAERRKEKRQGVTMDPEGWMLMPLLALPFTVVQCLLHIYNTRPSTQRGARDFTGKGGGMYN